MAYAYLGMAYAFLVRIWYWALEVGLVLWALITKGYFLGLTQDVDHFDLGFFVIRIGDSEYW